MCLFISNTMHIASISYIHIPCAIFRSELGWSWISGQGQVISLVSAGFDTFEPTHDLRFMFPVDLKINGFLQFDMETFLFACSFTNDVLLQKQDHNEFLHNSHHHHHKDKIQIQ